MLIHQKDKQSKCHECGYKDNLPERRVLYGNQVWYRYICKECGTTWELATITIGKSNLDELEIMR